MENNLLETIENFKILEKELESKVHLEIKPFLMSLCKDPITSFRFRAYTPYFNDGDPCEFSVNDAYYKWIGQDNPEGESNDYEGADGFEYYSEDKEIEKFIAEIGTAIHSIPARFIQSSLGDHIMVTVTKDSIEVGECSHD